jgi:hypothetical protein
LIMIAAGLAANAVYLGSDVRWCFSIQWGIDGLVELRISCRHNWWRIASSSAVACLKQRISSRPAGVDGSGSGGTNAICQIESIVVELFNPALKIRDSIPRHPMKRYLREK